MSHMGKNVKQIGLDTFMADIELDRMRGLSLPALTVMPMAPARHQQHMGGPRARHI
jgi:hypothetical protein